MAIVTLSFLLASLKNACHSLFRYIHSLKQLLLAEDTQITLKNMFYKKMETIKTFVMSLYSTYNAPQETSELQPGCNKALAIGLIMVISYILSQPLQLHGWYLGRRISGKMCGLQLLSIRSKEKFSAVILFFSLSPCVVVYTI